MTTTTTTTSMTTTVSQEGRGGRIDGIVEIGGARGPEATALWARLREFQFDLAQPAFGFAARLAKEQGWTNAFAARAIEEYRRFVYLAMTAGHPVTPSPVVDEVWHLHLTYTRSYWDRMCGQVLGKPLHHDPTQGGAAEDAKFVDWYGRTKVAYAKAFGVMPPGDIWPARHDQKPVAKGADHGPTSEVTARRVPSSVWRRILPSAVATALVVVTGVVLAGCASTWQGNSGPAVLLIFGAVAVVSVLALVGGWMWSQRGEREVQTSGKRSREPNRATSDGGSTGCGAGGFWFLGGMGSGGGGGGAGSGMTHGHPHGTGHESPSVGGGSSSSGGASDSTGSASDGSGSSSGGGSDSGGGASSGCGGGGCGGGGD